MNNIILLKKLFIMSNITTLRHFVSFHLKLDAQGHCITYSPSLVCLSL